VLLDVCWTVLEAPVHGHMWSLS